MRIWRVADAACPSVKTRCSCPVLEGACVAHPNKSPPVASSSTSNTEVGRSYTSRSCKMFSCRPYSLRIVISVRSDSRSFSSPPVRRRLAMIFRAYVSLDCLSSIKTTLPNEPCPRNRSSVRPETFLAYFSWKGVVEHKLGSSRAVLRLDWRQPISRRVCDGWAALLCRAGAAAMEGGGGFAKRVRNCSLGRLAARNGVSESEEPKG